jgi:Ca2+-binding EF-hand superfamily protein
MGADSFPRTQQRLEKDADDSGRLCSVSLSALPSWIKQFHIFRFKSQLSRFTKPGLFRTVLWNVKRIDRQLVSYKEITMKKSVIWSAVAVLTMACGVQADNAKLEKRFEKYDSDKDGVMQKEEYMAMRASWGKEGPESEAYFNNKDKNGDGELTKEEFGIKAAPAPAASAEAAQPGKAKAAAPDDARFVKYDTNKDGVMQKEEFMAMRASWGKDEAESEKIFNFRDKNEDGELSVEEFTAK